MSSPHDPRGNSLAVRGELPTHAITPEIIKEIALEIGKEVASHIEIMYPKAVKATSKNMLVSMRNVVSNNILAAVTSLNEGDAIAWIETRRAIRRKMRADHRKVTGEAFIEGSAEYE